MVNEPIVIPEEIIAVITGADGKKRYISNKPKNKWWKIGR